MSCRFLNAVLPVSHTGNNLDGRAGIKMKCRGVPEEKAAIARVSSPACGLTWIAAELKEIIDNFNMNSRAWRKAVPPGLINTAGGSEEKAVIAGVSSHARGFAVVASELNDIINNFKKTDSVCRKTGPNLRLIKVPKLTLIKGNLRRIAPAPF